jgi:phosphatidylglycerophosphatase A
VSKIIIFFSSVFGVGYIKYIPGTLGSLIGALLWILFVPDNYIFQIFMLAAISVVSILLSSLADNIYDKRDNQRIVTDEVAGLWFSVAFLPKTLINLSLGFLLFRAFDVKKPLFIKKFQKLSGGVGITLDDIAAGVFVNIILQVIRVIF